MEYWDADLSPCNYATSHFPTEESSFVSLQLRDQQLVFCIYISLELFDT